MPAQKRKRKRSSASRLKRRTFLYFVVSVFIVFLGVISISLVDFWNNNSKLTLLVQGLEGDLHLITFDPVVDEITDIIIPSNTEVEVAQHFGVFRVSNVWRLGFSEGLRGDLLAKTVTKNFKFPVYIWAENGALGFASTNYVEVANAVFSRYKTNLKIGDKIRIAVFSVGVPNSRRIEINLSDTPYLKKTKLIDGQDGYVIEKNIPVSILSVFADSTITKGEYRVVITNNTSSTSIANQVGEIVEVLGAKVASVRRGESDIDGCVVEGIDRETVTKIAKIFNCRPGEQEQDVNFDIEIVLGGNFEETF